MVVILGEITEKEESVVEGRDDIIEGVAEIWLIIDEVEGARDDRRSVGGVVVVELVVGESEAEALSAELSEGSTVELSEGSTVGLSEGSTVGLSEGSLEEVDADSASISSVFKKKEHFIKIVRQKMSIQKLK